ncbi:MAG: radical SAM/SPASM domain-containing protein [Candidatus Hodarchaeales archaeon]|jgi:MoaA/NifB/PqqE/SkfB family radical SAM enzyme
MVSGLHFLLSYTCIFECDHCFVYSSPNAKGTFSISQVKEILDQAENIPSIDTIYFEGGEPFLFNELLISSVKYAKHKGFKVGIVTNGYWANSEENAELALQPFQDIGIYDLSISDDDFHYENEENHSKIGMKVAKNMKLPVDSICIDRPTTEFSDSEAIEKGEPIIGGTTMFRGRAVDTMAENEELPKKNWQELKTCPYEELREPSRVHIDPYGNIHLCQGISIGNVFKEPLKEIFENYDYLSHPIFKDLVEGGPAQIVTKHDIELEFDSYIDECHLCFVARRKIIKNLPYYLNPSQVYGLE